MRPTVCGDVVGNRKMLNALKPKPPIASVPDAAPLRPPRWASELAAQRGLATLVTTRVDGFRHGDPQRLSQQVIDAYEQVRQALCESPHQHIVRMWNHIPGIHDPLNPGQDRYMLFNAGRFAAMRMWFGAAEEIRRCVPAASGVGHDGDDLVIHALAMATPGVAVENPDQVPAYHYSPRYGPVPPCFARATRVMSPMSTLFISGTAAITGEESRFGADLEKQFELTLRNLSIVIAKARDDDHQIESPPRPSPLETLQHIRIYVPPGVDQQAVDRLARSAFVESTSIEWVSAELCRSDLLVEIEGVARLS